MFHERRATLVATILRCSPLLPTFQALKWQSVFMEFIRVRGMRSGWRHLIAIMLAGRFGVLPYCCRTLHILFTSWVSPFKGA